MAARFPRSASLTHPTSWPMACIACEVAFRDFAIDQAMWLISTFKAMVIAGTTKRNKEIYSPGLNKCISLLQLGSRVSSL